MEFRLEVDGELVEKDPLPIGVYTVRRSRSAIPLPFGVYIEGPKSFPSNKRIIAQSKSVSRRHLGIIISEESATIEDLGSKYGSYLNEERFEGERVIDSPGYYSLKLGDKFMLGLRATE